MKRLRLIVVTAVVGLGLLTPLPVAGPSDCPDDVGKTCAPGPAQAPPAPQGATAICRDGGFSFSPYPPSACSKEGGVSQWLGSGSGV